MKTTPNDIVLLEPDEVFVFGSNESGIHGAGAAKTAVEKFGAVMGQGVGLQGQSYAIPTKDFDIRVLPLDIIKHYVDEFIEFAKYNPEIVFLVTQIGCGLSGYSPKDIAPMFKKISDNVIIPKVFHDELSRSK
jgi:hypothetical protein